MLDLKGPRKRLAELVLRDARAVPAERAASPSAHAGGGCSSPSPAHPCAACTRSAAPDSSVRHFVASRSALEGVSIHERLADRDRGCSARHSGRRHGLAGERVGARSFAASTWCRRADHGRRGGAVARRGTGADDLNVLAGIGDHTAAAADRVQDLDWRFLALALTLQLATLRLRAFAWRNVLAAAYPAATDPGLLAWVARTRPGWL